jgi:hypothetical protein
MKRITLAVILLLPFTQSIGKGIKSNSSLGIQTESSPLKGHKFLLKYQLFESHDGTGTDIDTVSHQGDYIFFSLDGKAYMNFKGKLDSIAYNFPTKQSVGFGDTPFVITSLGNGSYKLYQNEQTANGDYNRVTYLLEKEADL